MSPDSSVTYLPGKKGRSPQPAALRFLDAYLDDAHQRYWRSGREVVEHDVGRVGGHRGKVHTSASKSA
jgi:hypothetical protein